MSVRYDTIEQWVDWGGHTQTVDPVRNKAWIHEGQEGKHLATSNRGKAYDARDVNHLFQILNKDTISTAEFYVPTAIDLATIPAFPSRRSNGCDMWRGDSRDLSNVGKLPVLRAQHRMGALREVDKGDIERQMYQSQHAINHKIYSRAGVPNHGLPCDGTEVDY